MSLTLTPIPWNLFHDNLSDASYPRWMDSLNHPQCTPHNPFSLGNWLFSYWQVVFIEFLHDYFNLLFHSFWELSYSLLALLFSCIPHLTYAFFASSADSSTDLKHITLTFLPHPSCFIHLEPTRSNPWSTWAHTIYKVEPFSHTMLNIIRVLRVWLAYIRETERYYTMWMYKEEATSCITQKGAFVGFTKLVLHAMQSYINTLICMYILLWDMKSTRKKILSSQ